jgi:hypothetical protein
MRRQERAGLCPEKAPEPHASQKEHLLSRAARLLAAAQRLTQLGGASAVIGARDNFSHINTLVCPDL